MKLNPICNQCGQSDEFFVSEDDVYICICGHKCTDIIEIHEDDVLKSAIPHYYHLVKPQYTH